MCKWEELKQKEQGLLDREESIFREKKQVQWTQEVYDEHFRQAHYFMNEVQYLFYQNAGRRLYETSVNEFYKESRKIMQDLEEGEYKINLEKRKIQMDLEIVFYEKRKAGEDK